MASYLGGGRVVEKPFGMMVEETVGEVRVLGEMVREQALRTKEWVHSAIDQITTPNPDTHISLLDRSKEILVSMEPIKSGEARDSWVLGNLLWTDACLMAAFAAKLVGRFLFGNILMLWWLTVKVLVVFALIFSPRVLMSAVTSGILQDAGLKRKLIFIFSLTLGLLQGGAMKALGRACWWPGQPGPLLVAICSYYVGPLTGESRLAYLAGTLGSALLASLGSALVFGLTMGGAVLAVGVHSLVATVQIQYLQGVKRRPDKEHWATISHLSWIFASILLDLLTAAFLLPPDHASDDVSISAK